MRRRMGIERRRLCRGGRGRDKRSPAEAENRQLLIARHKDMSIRHDRHDIGVGGRVGPCSSLRGKQQRERSTRRRRREGIKIDRGRVLGSVGRPVAHMMAVPACVPFDETVVKVPASWPLATGTAAPSATNATVGEVCIFQTPIWAVFTPLDAAAAYDTPDPVWTGEIGRPAPARPYRSFVEYVVGASGRKSAQAGAIEQIHRSSFAGGHRQIRKRTGLGWHEEHAP